MSDEIERLAQDILTSKKYRDLGLSESTVRDLLAQELPRYRSRKDALDEVRRRLHNIVAPYLGDPDYSAAMRALDAAFDSGDEARVQAVCLEILGAHASTRERIPILAEFYARIFEVIGTPRVVLDLACGLNPLAFPWMGLPLTTRYYAYDIHRPRLELINHFFTRLGLEPLGIQQDILVDPPDVEADAAFFFKEAHRVEQRRHGANRPLVEAVRARWVLISLPASSLTGRHDLAERQRALVAGILNGLDWPVRELIVGSEMVFIVEKN